MRVDFEDNVIKLVRAVGRKAHATGQGDGLTTYRQLAEVLYGADVIRDQDDTRRVRTSIRRWMRAAERAGLVAFEEALSPDGGSACLRWRQLDPLRAAVDPVAVAEAIAELEPHADTVRENYGRRDRQRQRWAARCPRAGRGAARRLVDPGPRRFHVTPKTDPPCRSFPPTGKTNIPRDKRERENEPPDQRSRMDAIERACPPSHRPALQRWRKLPSKEDAWPALQAAADSGGLDAVPAALAAWAIASEGREPRLSRSMAAQLERSAGQFDRINGRGAAAGWIVHRIRSGWWSDCQNFGRRVTRHESVTTRYGRRMLEEEVNLGVESIAFYVLQLRQLARLARRHARTRAAAAKARAALELAELERELAYPTGYSRGELEAAIDRRRHQADRRAKAERDAQDALDRLAHVSQPPRPWRPRGPA